MLVKLTKRTIFALLRVGKGGGRGTPVFLILVVVGTKKIQRTSRASSAIPAPLPSIPNLLFDPSLSTRVALPHLRHHIASVVQLRPSHFRTRSHDSLLFGRRSLENLEEERHRRQLPPPPGPRGRGVRKLLDAVGATVYDLVQSAVAQLPRLGLPRNRRDSGITNDGDEAPSERAVKMDVDRTEDEDSEDVEVENSEEVEIEEEDKEEEENEDVEVENTEEEEIQAEDEENENVEVENTEEVEIEEEDEENEDVEVENTEEVEIEEEEEDEENEGMEVEKTEEVEIGSTEDGENENKKEDEEEDEVDVKEEKNEDEEETVEVGYTDKATEEEGMEEVENESMEGDEDEDEEGTKGCPADIEMDASLGKEDDFAEEKRVVMAIDSDDDDDVPTKEKKACGSASKRQRSGEATMTIEEAKEWSLRFEEGLRMRGFEFSRGECFCYNPDMGVGLSFEGEEEEWGETLSFEEAMRRRGFEFSRGEECYNKERQGDSEAGRVEHADGLGEGDTEEDQEGTDTEGDEANEQPQRQAVLESGVPLESAEMEGSEEDQEGTDTEGDEANDQPQRQAVLES